MTAFLKLHAWNYDTGMAPNPESPTLPVYVNADLISTVRLNEGPEGGAVVGMQGGATRLIVREHPAEIVAVAETQ